MSPDGRGDPVGNLGSGSCTISGGRQRRANRSVIGGRGLVFTGLESPTHLIIMLTIVLLLFGSKRIPGLAKGLGAGLHEFRKGAQGEVDEDTDEREDDSGIR
jgi:TatA/E family protein of Tat protein translocase